MLCISAKVDRRIRLPLDVAKTRAPTREGTMTLREKLIWTAVAVVGAISPGVVALTRGEPVNAAWLVTASVCIYFIAYRFYARFIAAQVYGLDAKRVTP